MSNLQLRLLVSALAVPFLIFVVYSAHSSPLLFMIVAINILLISLWELLQLMYHTGAKPLKTIVLGGSLLYAGAVFAASHSSMWHLAPQGALLIYFAILLASQLWQSSEPLPTIAYTIFPFAYLTIPLSCAISIVYFSSSQQHIDGRWWLLFLVAVTKGYDAAAYFVGRGYGKHLLAPYVSPKKTYEGALGGIVAAAIIGGALAYLAPLSIEPRHAVLLAIVLAVVAQFGDLTESLLKRSAGIKNSNGLPGLGGMLDVVDSLIFTTPLLYLFLNTYYG
jgi:phosphatidate cytidylyltransferase